MTDDSIDIAATDPVKSDLHELNKMVNKYNAGYLDLTLLVYEAYLLGLGAVDPFEHDQKLQLAILRKATIILGSCQLVGEWLFSPIEEFASFTPIMLLRMGREDKIMKYLEQQANAGLPI